MELTPDFQRIDGFRIVGVERFTGNGGRSAIQAAWQEFGRRVDEIPFALTPLISYGFEDYSREYEAKPGEFPSYYYTAALGVDDVESLPAGMVAREVPSATYAVFRYVGSLAKMHEAFQYIYNKWLPASGYTMDPAIQGDFERYTKPVTDMENAEVEICIPVVASP